MDITYITFIYDAEFASYLRPLSANVRNLTMTYWVYSIPSIYRFEPETLANIPASPYLTAN